jgi:hypothetical protein
LLIHKAFSMGHPKKPRMTHKFPGLRLMGHLGHQSAMTQMTHDRQTAGAQLRKPSTLRRVTM